MSIELETSNGTVVFRTFEPEQRLNESISPSIGVDAWPRLGDNVKALSRDFFCNLKRNSTIERCEIGNYESLSNFPK